MEDIVFIEANGWRILSVPFLIMFSLFIIALIMKKSSNEVEELKKNEKNLTSWVTQKDILYWLLIMCLGTISIFTFQYSGDKDVISHWGFAGTIVSIILAVVAIGFTLFQTLSSDLSSSKITESAEIISKVSAKLNSSDLAMAGEVVKKAAEDLINYKAVLESSISEVHNDLKTHQKENFDNIRESIDSTIYFRSKAKNVSGNSDTIEIIDLKDFFESIYPNFNEELRIYIYAILYRTMFLGEEIEESLSNEFFETLITTTNFYKNIVKDIKGELSKFEEGLLFGTSITNYYTSINWLINFDILDRFETLIEDEQKEILIGIKNLINKDSIKIIETI